MAQAQALKVEARDGTGKGPAYQARLKGLIPAVVYGGADKPENVAVDARTLERAIEAGHFLTTLFTLDVAGEKIRVIPREVQLDPVSDRPVHVDFMRLAEGATVRLDIPVHFNGQGVSPGLKKGGVLNIVRHSIALICPADSHSQHRGSGRFGAGHQRIHPYQHPEPAQGRQAGHQGP